MDEQMVKLTGQPVSEEMKNILNRLSNKEYVDIDQINNTKEIKIARSNIDYSRPTIQLDNRMEIQENAINKMLKLGSATIDEAGKTVYNGDIMKNARLDIVVGLPASGKSSAIVDSLSQEFHSKVIDNDEAKKMIPQYNDGWGAGVVHEESQKISDIVFSMSIDAHENIVLPKVGSNAERLLKDYIEPAIEAGYKVNVHFVDLDRNKALGRMINRFIEEGRFLDPNLINKYCNEKDGNKIEKAYEQLKESNLVHGFSKWDNDVERGEKPILMEYSNLEGNFISNARIGDVEYERANERTKGYAKDITIDSRNNGESGRNDSQSSYGNEKGQCSDNSRYDSERGFDDNGQVLQVGQIVTQAESERTNRNTKDNPLAKVEELEEVNYNMIDGVINNEKPKKEEKETTRISIKEKLAQMKEKSELLSLKKEKVSEVSKKKQEISM